jgi:uncharacterized membrane protein
MIEAGFDVIVAAIEDNLDYLHKQRWNARAAELHSAEADASDPEREGIRQALRDHYADRFCPETSRAALLEQARKNYAERQSA